MNDAVKKKNKSIAEVFGSKNPRTAMSLSLAITGSFYRFWAKRCDESFLDKLTKNSIRATKTAFNLPKSLPIKVMETARKEELLTLKNKQLEAII